MKVPGPDHPITIAPHPKRVVVTVAGRTLADTRKALALTEANYPPVFYIPREDIDLARMRRTDHATHCPYKGEAAYFSATLGGPEGVNAAWSYEAPFAAVAAIRDHLAFYPDRVDAIEEKDG